MIRKSQVGMGRNYHLLTGVALASMLVVLAPVRAEGIKPSDHQEMPEFVLPALPDVEASTQHDLAGVSAASTPEQKRAAIPEPETVLDLPTLPEVLVALEPAERFQPTPTITTLLSAEALSAKEVAVDIAPPDVPTVIVSIEMPAGTLAPKPEASSGITAPKPLDIAVLRAHLEGERNRLKFKPGIIDGILAAYAEQGNAPAWISDDGTLSPALSALQDTLSRAGQHSLDPQRLLSVLPATLTGLVPDTLREKVDAAISLAAFLYAHDARGGRLEPTRLSSLLTPNLSLPAPAELLPRLWKAAPETRASILEAYQPAHPGYLALKARLAALRAEMAEPITTSTIASPMDTLPKTFMEGGLLTPGQRDPRVPALRIRLNIPAENTLAQDNDIYDAALVEAVKAFQRANGLTPNGRITPKTREALQDITNPLTPAGRKANPREIIANIQANMERWRWLPPELGKTHIFVNVPEYRLDMMIEGQSIFNTRVIVGKPDTQTPIFSDAMDFLVVNPSWHVPPSILKNEFIPRLAVDPEYASKRGYEVVRRGNSISVRQPPGDRNALGHVKFMFPNQHSVYLHDTPSRQLFHNATRAFSHGCVRVEGPFKLAEQILLAKQGFTEKSLRAMVGHGERTIRLSEKIPVHLTYFTLGVDVNGALISRADIYGHDARIRKALAL